MREIYTLDSTHHERMGHAFRLIYLTRLRPSFFDAEENSGSRVEDVFLRFGMEPLPLWTAGEERVELLEGANGSINSSRF